MKQDDVDALVPHWKEAGMAPPLIAALELSKRVARLHLLFEQALKADLAELGLTYAEFDVLATLNRAPGHRMKPSELARSLFLTSGGISNVLQRLEAAGHVEREADTGDARSRWVRLTAAGHDIAHAAARTAAGTYGDLTAGVPDEAVRQAADALREVLAPLGRRRLR